MPEWAARGRSALERHALQGGWAWLTSALVVLLSWPNSTLFPHGSSLDASWHAGIAVAAREGLHHGSDVLFTYGPLGVLGIPPTLWWGTSAALGLAFMVAVHVGLVRALLHHLGRDLPGVLAVPAALLLHAFLNFKSPPEILTLTMLLVLLALIAKPPSRSALPGWWALGTLVAITQLLVKFNDGIYCLGLLGLGVLALSERRVRDVAATAALALALLPVLWLLAQQRLVDLVPWLMGSLELTSGYTEAMSVEYVERLPEYVLGAVLLAATLWFARQEQLRSGIWPLVVLLWVLFLAGKHGFVRHDAHAAGFFLVLAVVPLALHASPVWQRLTASAAAAVCAMLSLGAPAPPPVLTDAVRSPGLAAGQVLDIADPARRAAHQSAMRSVLEPQIGLSPEELAAVAGRPVHVGPHNTAAMWLHSLPWNPVPVFQTYTAYTPELDELNAAALRSPDAPPAILRERIESIDERLTAFESPAYTMAMLCHYRQEFAGDQWLVLARAVDRCGEARPLGTVEHRDGQHIDVPRGPAGHLVYAQIDLPADPLGAVQELFFKPLSHAHASLDGLPARRLVEANLEQPLVMSVPHEAQAVPQVLSDSQVDYLRLDNVTDGARVTFFAVPFTS
jgi:hypothetical protein